MKRKRQIEELDLNRDHAFIKFNVLLKEVGTGKEELYEFLNKNCPIVVRKGRSRNMSSYKIDGIDKISRLFKGDRFELDLYSNSLWSTLIEWINTLPGQKDNKRREIAIKHLGSIPRRMKADSDFSNEAFAYFMSSRIQWDVERPLFGSWSYYC